MGLLLPVIGTATGLQWQSALNANSAVLDSHNHSSGSGAQITPLGLNINSNLSFQNNSITNLFGVQFSVPQTSSLLTFLYTAPQSGGGVNDLFFNDGVGNVIPLTKAGIVNATAASIPGESYSGGTFTWKQGSGSTTPANFDIGFVTLRPNTAGTTNGIQLQTPSGISSFYQMILPALPAAQNILTLDNSGNIVAAWNVDNSTLVVASNLIQVNAAGIGTTQIANGSVTSAKMAANIAVTGYLSTGTELYVGGMSTGGIQIFAQTAYMPSYDFNGDSGAAYEQAFVLSPQPSNTSLKIIRGVVNSNGTRNTGEGWSVVYNSTGHYTVSFGTAFVVDTLPTIVVTPVSFGAAINATIQSQTLSGFSLITTNSGTAQDTQFSFMAIGQWHT